MTKLLKEPEPEGTLTKAEDDEIQSDASELVAKQKEIELSRMPKFERGNRINSEPVLKNKGTNETIAKS
jgi:hypothetical protein